ncbi:beta-ketoacyl synthase N-terminal-like domain-containing protein [Saccharothrix sp. HUAS TT1]|uniref:beta-ketoacyl synthase N-terminal-like domain-containing protein n=1 Tax=unclassified Saccharothrix TaxID=2593673 RepID=UPI00345C537A
MSTAPDTLAITGWGVLTSTGFGADEFAAAVREGRSGLVDVEGAFDEQLPTSKACALVGFHARDHLGRKGTSFLDRSTSLALIGCELALNDTGLVVDDANRDRVGIVLGTTAGSLKATSDYSRETLVQDKPYLVNPMLFPNTVMNCAAGQSAIWHKLKGVNATVAGGQLAGLNALRYTRNLVRRGYVDGALVGAVEEFSPHTAWSAHHLHRQLGVQVPVGEGSAVFVAENPDVARAAGRTPDAEVLAVEIGYYAPTGQLPDAGEGLATTIARALERAGVAADEVWAVATGETGAQPLDEVEARGVAAVFGGAARRVRVKELTGECQAASGALQLAALLSHHRDDRALDGRVGVVTSVSADGAVGAAVVRGYSRA